MVISMALAKMNTVERRVIVVMYVWIRPLSAVRSGSDSIGLVVLCGVTWSLHNSCIFKKVSQREVDVKLVVSSIIVQRA
jgi:hypothetical protein